MLESPDAKYAKSTHGRVTYKVLSLYKVLVTGRQECCSEPWERFLKDSFFPKIPERVVIHSILMQVGFGKV